MVGTSNTGQMVKGIDTGAITKSGSGRTAITRSPDMIKQMRVVITWTSGVQDDGSGVQTAYNKRVFSKLSSLLLTESDSGLCYPHFIS